MRDEVPEKLSERVMFRKVNMLGIAKLGPSPSPLVILSEKKNLLVCFGFVSQPLTPLERNRTAVFG